MDVPQQAKFALVDYAFTEFNFTTPENNEETPLNVTFNPSGKFYATQGKYELSLLVSCANQGSSEVHITASMTADFHITDNGNEIPDFFYRNSIAILFPYIRAFISTLTLQSNAGLIILPTLNLTNLDKTLRDNTIIIEE